MSINKFKYVEYVVLFRMLYYLSYLDPVNFSRKQCADIPFGRVAAEKALFVIFV